MDKDTAKKLLAMRGQAVTSWLEAYMADERDVPPRLKEAMAYSLLAGGKRLRPVLCLATASLCGADPSALMPFSAALEMIHTYSLIHDDLPAMDNDDLRRGRPSCHKAFDEATAILAGDGLLTDSFYLMTRAGAPPERLLPAIGLLARAAGSSGMVGGQALDMECTGAAGISLDTLKCLHALKTGALLRASCECGAVLAGASPDLRAKCAKFGEAFGREFQIIDDLKDVLFSTEELGKPAKSDLEQGKTTYPSLLGMLPSCRAALEEARKATASLAGLEGVEAEFLKALVELAAEPAVAELKKAGFAVAGE